VKRYLVKHRFVDSQLGKLCRKGAVIDMPNDWDPPVSTKYGELAVYMGYSSDGVFHPDKEPPAKRGRPPKAQQEE
jgi:hypothetical protein